MSTINENIIVNRFYNKKNALAPRGTGTHENPTTPTLQASRPSLRSESLLQLLNEYIDLRTHQQATLSILMNFRRMDPWTLCLLYGLIGKGIEARIQTSSSFGQPRRHIFHSDVSHHGLKTLTIRGGIQPSNASRNYWSTSTHQPTSFQQSQKDAARVTVTDVTDELREEERQATKEEIDSFLTRESRNTFIARVYGILTIQLALVGKLAKCFS